MCVAFAIFSILMKYDDNEKYLFDTTCRNKTEKI